jgi:hypothetical protein
LTELKAAALVCWQTSFMNTNRADPRLVWLASVLAAMVVVVFIAQS